MKIEKPKKKELVQVGTGTFDKKNIGYNQALDDIDKWLPSEKELVDILILQNDLRSGEQYEDFMERLAKAISKRLNNAKKEKVSREQYK